jgi:hypothetical protein
MTKREIYLSALRIGERADTLCRALPGSKLHMPLRDLSLAVEHAAKALSKLTLEAIARS